MALFKIFKGRDSEKLTQSTAPGYIAPTTDGYAYYDLSTKLFYIDAEYTEGAVSRQPINAAYASAAANASNGIYYAECPTATATPTKVATLVDDYGFNLTTGTMVIVHFTYASCTANMTLTLQNSTGSTITAGGVLYQYGSTAMGQGTTSTGWVSGATVPLVYNGTNWSRLFWNNNNSTYTVPGVWSGSGSATAAKTATATYYALREGNVFEITTRYSNTTSTSLTLNINSTGAKPIYINGQPSSSTNHTLPAGKYTVYYDGTAYHFNTYGLTERAIFDDNGNAIADKYATGISFSNGIISLLNSSNTAIATATMAIYDGSYSFTSGSPMT